MLLGNHIDVTLSLNGDQTKASISFNGKLIGGITSVDLEVVAGQSGEEVKRLVFKMWDPREMYYNEERFKLQQDFIEEARRCGAVVNLTSWLDIDQSSSGYEQEELEPEVPDIARIAAVCAAIAGLAAIIAPKNKKHKVQDKMAISKFAEQQSISTKRK